MSPRRRDQAHVLALAVLAFAIALLQRPGLASSDTKIDLHVDPAGFLGDVAGAWSSTGDLGHVQGGQYGGYLFPMGPFFALGHALGLGPWLVQRLWFGLILALAAWGAVRLMDELAGRPRGVAHAVTGLLVLLNPYVVVFSARTTVTLLGYAALPWLLVCVRRGILNPNPPIPAAPRRRGHRPWPIGRDPKGSPCRCPADRPWTRPTTPRLPRIFGGSGTKGSDPFIWPAAFALIVTASGGGVNAAVTAWMLVGPLLLALYERWAGSVTWRALWRFGWRTAVATGLVSAWWVVPLLVQSRFGVDFLRFTEQPGTIWSTTSLPESLRMMGYWISYLGVGYGGELRPYFGDGGVLLFALPVVLAGLLIPALALTGFVWTRKHRYGPFALLLVIAGLLIMTAGFPEGTPLRRASNFTYNHLLGVQFLRTTYKAGPLVLLGLAVLAGLGAARLPKRVLLVPALLLPLLASWPLIRGRGVDDQLLWDEIPAAWQRAAAHVDTTTGDGRAVVLPGQLYAYYDWGGTIDPILPVLADKPVATRNAVGYADLRATDLLWTVDALVQQRRAVPEQLGPLLDLLGARTVLAGADDDRTRSGAAPAAEAADVLTQLGNPNRAWGERKARPRAAGTIGDPVELPEVRAWDRPDAQGLVRVAAPDPWLVLDGSAEGVAALATPINAPLSGFAYAADLSPAALRRVGEVVITDSNRRRVLVPSRLAQNAGPVLAAGEEPSVDAAVLDPFAKGSDAQTVAVYGGIAGATAPSSPGYPQFPEHRPFAALDGDTATHWQADRTLTPDRHTLDVTFTAPRDVPYVDLMPYDDRNAKVTAVEIAGRTHPVHPGWNRLRLGLRGVKALQVRIVVREAPGPTVTAGIRELKIPGVKPTEALRPPVIAERALKGQDLSKTSLMYVFQRTTGDDPFRRDPWHGSASSALVRDRGDGERGLERVFSPPVIRTWRMGGWVSTAPGAADSALDAVVGLRGAFNSSARFEGRPIYRASSAFDNTQRPWIGSWQDGRTAWVEWEGRATLRELTLDPADGVRRPTQVRLRSERAESPPVSVGPDGVVRLPEPIRGRRFRLEILRAAFPAGTPGIDRQRRAVGIAEIRGEGMPSVTVPRSGTLGVDCSDVIVTVGGRRVGMHVDGAIGDLDAGRPLRASACEPFALSAGTTRLSARPGTFTPYLLRLRSSANRRSTAAPGRVLSAGTATRGGREGIRLALDGPARLILAESYNRGRRASCDGRDLGVPEVGDGYGTAWRVPASCREVKITFGPNRLVNAGYAVSVIIAAILLGLLLVRGRRRARGEPSGETDARERAGGEDAAGERAGSGGAAGERAGTEGVRGAAAAGVAGARGRSSGSLAMPARRAALIAVPVALAFGFVFAARGTPLFAIGVFAILWRGIGAKPLALAGGAVLGIAVPILTLLIRPDNRGGYNPEYSIDRIEVHWVAVAGIALFVLALSRAMGRPGRARSAPPSDAAPRAPAP